ncbi:hypothetical protein R1flu_024562 [Riccia fluitans]|uniref:Uncharacterized protein n=1 Tax=Riccia fluitans TaxID=41844 RepID=A0ABD1XV94_9MARC
MELRKSEKGTAGLSGINSLMRKSPSLPHSGPVVGYAAALDSRSLVQRQEGIDCGEEAYERSTFDKRKEKKMIDIGRSSN